MDFRTEIIDVTRRHYETKIEQHRINAEVILNHVIAVGLGEDITQAFDNEIAKMSEYENKLLTLKHYFK
jgi:hypothetical protein